MTALDLEQPLTEEWLKDTGFRWSQLDRQPTKHWTLWMGAVVDRGRGAICYEDLGVEVAPDLSDGWHCWLRADYSGRYSRFIHLRHIQTRADLIFILEGIAGTGFDPKHVCGGSWVTPETAARYFEDEQRLDRVIMRQRPWHEVERDDSMGGARPEHMQGYVDSRKMP